MTNPKILLVDDDPMIRRSCVRTFKDRRGIDLETASDGREAMLRLAKESFDFVICDVNMPGWNGIKLLESVKSRQPHLVAKFIFHTSEPERVTSMGVAVASKGDFTKLFEHVGCLHPSSAKRQVEE